jgi:TPR repeat protein
MPVKENYRMHLARRWLWMVPITVMSGLVQVCLPVPPARAMGISASSVTEVRGRPIIRVQQLRFDVEDISSEPMPLIPIKVLLPTAASLNQAGASTGTFVLIANIPQGISFSQCMSIGRNWVVSLSQAEDFAVLVRPGLIGQFQLEFHLIGPGNQPLARTSAMIRLQAGDEAKASAAAANQPDAGAVSEQEATATVPPALAPNLNADEQEILLVRGEQLRDEGGIAAARLIFEELASQGNAKAALALARTFDPSFLANSATSTVAPNLQEARRWYKRAADLGSPEAQSRIAELPQ